MVGLSALLVIAGGAHAQEVATRQHLEITGSHTLRITYDCSFDWPEGGGYTAVFRLPIPQDTGAQHIDSFTSTLKGTVVTDEANPPHRLLTGTLHHRDGDERRVHWRIVITGHFQTRQLASGPADAAAVITAPPEGEYLASTESINWKSDSFQEWLDASGLRRRSGETAVDFGARVYAYFRAHGRLTPTRTTTGSSSRKMHSKPPSTLP